jgi:hypothetical protein
MITVTFVLVLWAVVYSVENKSIIWPIAISLAILMSCKSHYIFSIK